MQGNYTNFDRGHVGHTHASVARCVRARYAQCNVVEQPMNIRSINADDAEGFSALRREVTRENPVPMGLTYEEELTRTLDSFRAQLSFSHPNAMFGGFVDGELAATAAVGHTSKFPSSRHKMVTVSYTHLTLPTNREV